MQDIVFDDLTKTWPGRAPAVDHLDMTIRAGELVGLVGPSGCGKTTVLRMLGGLESPTSGRVFLGARDITRLPARERWFGLVTQQNQLLGHLSAGENISFPLQVRDEFARLEDVQRRLGREASRLGIEALLEQRPKTLSEGQRRLVQLARAVIGAPVALLLDEPLANLEDQVRLRVRSEIVGLHHDRGLTSVLATASQADAMAMCDRIAVLFDGCLEQYGTPAEIYARPATAAVARFFGEPPMNVLRGRVEATATGRSVRVLDRSVQIATPSIDAYRGSEILVGIRAEDVAVGAPTVDSAEAVVRATEGIGHQTMVHAEAGGTRVDCVLPGHPPRAGTVLDLALPSSRLHFFDPETGMAVHHPPG